MWDNALYTWYIAMKGHEPPEELAHRFVLQGCTVAVSEMTECAIASGAHGSVAVIGMCVDAVGKLGRDEDEIAQYIADHVGNVKELLELEPCLAGKYVIAFAAQDGEIYLIGDAIHTIQINYCRKNPGAAGSVAALVARQEHDTVSEKNREVRLASFDLANQMPGDLTLYENIFALLPNHYLILSKGEAMRFPAVCENKRGIDDVQLISNIVRTYAGKRRLVCPLTGGHDSRVNLAFLRKEIPDIPCFTMRHKGMPQTHPDLVIPPKVCEKSGQPYTVIPDQKADPKWIEFFDQLYGKGLWYSDTANLAATILSCFAGQTDRWSIINGDIIDQIGKVCISKNIPAFLMRPRYCRCRMGNTMALPYIRAWMKDARGDHSIDVCELFAWESRCGRWCSQGGQIYDLMGVGNLNIYNNRLVISAWTRVPRSQRIQCVIHEKYMSQFAPELKDIPYAALWSGVMKIIYNNMFLHYIGHYFDYYRKVYKRNQEEKVMARMTGGKDPE